MRMKDDEIQQKLVELETAILKEARPADNAQIKTVDSDSSLSKAPSKQDNIHTKHMSESTKSDIHYFGGIFLLLVGIILLFQHVRVTTGYMTYWGMTPGNSIGGLLVLLLVGVGWIVYNSKSIWGWLISALSICTIIFSIISGLRIHFVPISMLNLIFMLLPLAFGSAYLLKGIGGPKGVEDIIKSRIERGN